MKVKFYLQDMEESLKGDKKRIVKDVLFFSMDKPSITGEKNAVGTSFDNKATHDHVAQYRDAYKAFKKLNPNYKCAWPELEVEVEAPVEAPHEEVKIKAKEVKSVKHLE